MPPSTPADANGTLPTTGYAFLRQVTEIHWDWMFPLRSGRFNAEGEVRNRPPIAVAGGSTDTFTLPAFRRAVLEYNRWAAARGQPQFLNEGTVKQQAEEFLLFWAKSARETSGSSPGAPAPWITDYTNSLGESTQVWKGGLYWVEEVGHTTNPDGTSPRQNYVAPGHALYPPAPGRSYYGRGIIQLSWNYNYGAFSAWLYDNGLFTDLITRRDTLLQRPDYVATHGALSILSGIWFWMTQQAPKPSSHDVVMGQAMPLSASNRGPGLPALRTGFTVNGSTTPPAALGDTTEPSIFAYRVGTVINIVNGGIECNGAAATHPGPPQRVSYYNAFAMYFNDQFPGLGANRLPAATNIWQTSVKPTMDSQILSATCFNQRSY